MGLTLADLDVLSLGLLMDMVIERSNDDYDWPIKATQADFDKF